jgi:hypothetical protein
MLAATDHGAAMAFVPDLVNAGLIRYMPDLNDWERIAALTSLQQTLSQVSHYRSLRCKEWNPQSAIAFGTSFMIPSRGYWVIPWNFTVADLHKYVDTHLPKPSGASSSSSSTTGTTSNGTQTRNGQTKQASSAKP